MKNSDITPTSFPNELNKQIQKKDVDALYTALNRLEDLMDNVDNCGNCTVKSLCQTSSCQTATNCGCQGCQTCQSNCTCQSPGCQTCQSMANCDPNCNCCGNDASS